MNTKTAIANGIIKEAQVFKTQKNNTIAIKIATLLIVLSFSTTLLLLPIIVKGTINE